LVEFTVTAVIVNPTKGVQLRSSEWLCSKVMALISGLRNKGGVGIVCVAAWEEVGPIDHKLIVGSPRKVVVGNLA